MCALRRSGVKSLPCERLDPLTSLPPNFGRIMVRNPSASSLARISGLNGGSGRRSAAFASRLGRFAVYPGCFLGKEEDSLLEDRDSLQAVRQKTV